MADPDETLLPLPGWGNLLEQLSLPLRAYQQQLMRTYHPALRFGQQFWQAYGGWMRYWEQFAACERLVAVGGSPVEVPERRAEEGTSTTPPDTERLSTDVAWVLEVVRAQFEQLMSALNGVLAEQAKLLGEVVSHPQEGTPGHEEQVED